MAVCLRMTSLIFQISDDHCMVTAHLDCFFKAVLNVEHLEVPADKNIIVALRIFAAHPMGDRQRYVFELRGFQLRLTLSEISKPFRMVIQLNPVRILHQMYRLRSENHCSSFSLVTALIKVLHFLHFNMINFRLVRIKTTNKGLLPMFMKVFRHTDKLSGFCFLITHSCERMKTKALQQQVIQMKIRENRPVRKRSAGKHSRITGMDPTFIPIRQPIFRSLKYEKSGTYRSRCRIISIFVGTGGRDRTDTP